MGQDGGAEPRGPGRGEWGAATKHPGRRLAARQVAGRTAPGSFSRPGTRCVGQGRGVSFLGLPQQSPTQRGA